MGALFSMLQLDQVNMSLFQGSYEILYPSPDAVSCIGSLEQHQHLLVS